MVSRAFLFLCSLLIGSIATAGTWTTIDYPGTTGISVRGIDHFGRILGSASYPESDINFILQAGVFSTLPIPLTSTEVTGLNSNSLVTAQRVQSSYVFNINDGSLTPVVPFPISGIQVYVSGVNATGQIIGDYFNPAEPLLESNGQIHGFLGFGNDFVRLDFPGAIQTTPFGIVGSAAIPTRIVGTYFNATLSNLGNIRGFFQDASGFGTIDFPGVGENGITSPLAITAGVTNDSIQIVGYYVPQFGSVHGFLLKNGVFTTLDFPGATSTAADGINDLGEIVGNYTDASGVGHGFLYQQ